MLDRRAPGNLAARVTPLAGATSLGAGRFLATAADPQLLLPGSLFQAGYYFFSLHVAGAALRTQVRLTADTGEGFDDTASFGLAASRNRPVFRIVRLDRPARALRLHPADTPGEFQLHTLRFFRVPTAFAERRMRRRLTLVHGAFAGQPPAALPAALERLAGTPQPNAAGVRTRRDALYRLYSQTFPKPLAARSYAAWQADVEAPQEASLTARAPALLAGLTQPPRVSVLVPVCDPDPRHLEECLASVLAQSYPHLELCVVDDASTAPHVRPMLLAFAARDPRVRVAFRSKRGHISRATNGALALAEGELVAFLDHDDKLPPNALLHAVMALRDKPHALVAYGDEDKLDERGQRYDPHFKPRWNPELLLAQNYVGHLVVARTEAVRALGGLREGYEGSQDHDLLLRLTDHARPDQVVHVPHVLYHWRAAAGSTASAATAKPYAAEAGLRAVEDALRRRGIAGQVTHSPTLRHSYRVLPALPSSPPTVTLVMPTRDGGHVLQQALDSLLAHTRYPNFELVVVDNGSQSAQTQRVLERAASDRRVRVLRDDSPFNYSAINNRAVARTRSELVGLINDDIEVLDGDWLCEMASLALRPELGCVGAKLLYPDHTVQHAGVILGIGGVAGHAHRRLPATHPGYFGRLQLTHTLSAVTGACLVVRRAVYDAVGGLDEGLAVAFNDVDFCLRVRASGLRNVYTPHAVLLHHESATRGSDHSPERRARFASEVRFMRERWREALTDDPYYSPHLTREHEDFSIA